ncbi:glycoside hydrolase family 7 protein [Daldinia vernicosa]|uniref:glycoside hydrolase family 7 protein n=1 Tax=Daldinia vernicosa TaxID=114800 RepID=UPI0020084340|nr:glycoside hydrolase family 7 protein [Daldinia vernicosa]KAI0851563.1 glycoside hydrolase family 7 protein [Daldinia vernicosa]
MHVRVAVTAAWLLASQAVAQGIGNMDAHPQLTTEKCTKAGGCVKQNTSIVLDASFHPLRQVDGTSSCGGYDGALNKELCPDHEACAKNCVFDGADYEGNGVLADSNILTLNMYGERDGKLATLSPRVYLLDAKEDDYEILHLKNQEISFDVDVSKLICGMNGAMYLAEMNQTGARSALNPAGARYGTGYCDAQCPNLPFINGVANIDSRGACCNEMDLWEANSLASAFTAHACSQPGVYECEGDQCGTLGVCDKSGCAYNNWKMGNTTYYGPRTPPPGSSDNGNSTRFTVDTTRPFTVTTQFLTQGNPPDITKGILNEVRRLYIQDGVVIENAPVIARNMPPGDSLRMSHCQAVADNFENMGGLTNTGQALDRGMVLAFSIWNDDKQFMNWLDAGNAGPCTYEEGNPELIWSKRPDTSVTFMNIRWGDLGSTYNNGTVS